MRLDPSLAEKFEAVARRKGMSRQALIERALDQEIGLGKKTPSAKKRPDSAQAVDKANGKKAGDWLAVTKVMYDLDAGVIRAMGVGLKTGEAEALADIAKRHGTTRNALARIAIRYFLREVIAGRVDVDRFFKAETIKRPNMKVTATARE